MVNYNHQKEVRPDIKKRSNKNSWKGYGEYYEEIYGKAEYLYEGVL